MNRRMLSALGIGMVLGAGLSFFLDRSQGMRRRHMLVDRTVGKVRRGGRRLGRVGRGAAAEVYGLKQKATHLREERKDYDDVTLTRKVETEIFRDADAPKGTVNVNVENGVVYLRGEAPRPELIEELVAKARRVQGVREVENLLHLPETDAPAYQ